MGKIWGQQGFTECLKCNSKQNNTTLPSQNLYSARTEENKSTDKTVISWDGCHERNKHELKLRMLGSALDKECQGGPS